MALQNFVDQTGPVVSAAWLNQVDVFINSLFQASTTSLAARAAISAAQSGVNSDITSLIGIAGPIILAGLPGNAGQVLTSQGAGLPPVWSAGSGSGGGLVSFQGRTTPAAVLVSGDVTGALGFTPASLASPTFTGIPSAPTASVSTNTTQIATTAFVLQEFGALLPAYATLANPNFTGTPTAPTATTGTNTTQLATTAFVQSAVAGSVAGVSSFNTRTGAVILTPADVQAAVQAGQAAGNTWIYQPTTAAPGSSTYGSVAIGRIGTTAMTSTHGNSYAALEVANNQNAGSTASYANEYSISSVLTSCANIDPGNADWPQNVGVYQFAFQVGTAPVWGNCFQVADNSQTARTAAKGQLIGSEISIAINGTDNYQATLGLDLVPNSPTIPQSGVTTGNPWVAVRASSTPDHTTYAWQYAFYAQSGTAASFFSNAVGTWCDRFAGTYVVGISLETATISQSAIRLAASQYIDWFNGSSPYRMTFNASTGYLEFYNSSTRTGYINISAGPDGNLNNGINAGQLAANNSWSGTNTFSGGTFCNGGLGMGGTIQMNSNTIGWASSGNVTYTATSGAVAYPAYIDGFLRIYIDGTVYKIPFYAN